MKQITWIVLALFALVVTAQGASFDCQKASTSIEKLICNDPELSKLDEDLSATYKINMDVESKVLSIASIQLAQKEWIKKRNSCPDTSCVKDEYVVRISQLSAINKADEVQNSKAISSSEAVCRMVASYANTGDLGSLLAPEGELAPKMDDLDQVFGTNGEFGRTGDYWSVDFNEDGNSYYFMITSDGTMNINTAYAISSRKGSTVKTLDDSDDGNSTIPLLKIGNRFFVLSNSGPIPRSLGRSKPGKLWSMGKDGEFQSVCNFSQGNSELIVGKQNPVCSEIKLGHVNYVEYPFDHAVSPSSSGPVSLDPLKGLAKVDIDNDGITDNVVQLESNSSAGAGCGFRYVAVTDKLGASIPDTKLNKLLSGLDDFACGSKKEMFVYNGTTYIDSTIEAGNRTVHRIEKGKAETICEFRGSFAYGVNVSK